MIGKVATSLLGLLSLGGGGYATLRLCGYSFGVQGEFVQHEDGTQDTYISFSARDENKNETLVNYTIGTPSVTEEVPQELALKPTEQQVIANEVEQVSVDASSEEEETIETKTLSANLEIDVTQKKVIEETETIVAKEPEVEKIEIEIREEDMQNCVKYDLSQYSISYHALKDLTLDERVYFLKAKLKEEIEDILKQKYYYGEDLYTTEYLENHFNILNDVEQKDKWDKILDDKSESLVRLATRDCKRYIIDNGKWQIRDIQSELTRIRSGIPKLPTLMKIKNFEVKKIEVEISEEDMQNCVKYDLSQYSISYHALKDLTLDERVYFLKAKLKEEIEDILKQKYYYGEDLYTTEYLENHFNILNDVEQKDKWDKILDDKSESLVRLATRDCKRYIIDNGKWQIRDIQSELTRIRRLVKKVSLSSGIETVSTSKTAKEVSNSFGLSVGGWLQYTTSSKKIVNKKTEIKIPSDAGQTQKEMIVQSSNPKNSSLGLVSTEVTETIQPSLPRDYSDSNLELGYVSGSKVATVESNPKKENSEMVIGAPSVITSGSFDQPLDVQQIASKPKGTMTNSDGTKSMVFA